MKSIKLFGLALEGNNYDYMTIVELGLKTGYLIDPKCSTKEVFDFLKEQIIVTNNTFYKTWEDVVNKDRLGLLIDQLLHYESTYGSDFEATPFLMNEEFGKNNNVINFENFKTIKAATKETIIEKANSLFSSGIALKEDTINDVYDIYDYFNYLPNVDIIKNKEAKMKFCFQKNLLPNDPVEMVRFLVFLATDKTLLIKNVSTFNKIKNSNLDISKYVNKFGIEKLSSVFLRYKILFLAFKKSNEKNISIVNKLRKLANKNHTPYTPTYFESLLSNVNTSNDSIMKLRSELVNLGVFKKVSLVEALRERINNYEQFINSKESNLNNFSIDTIKNIISQFQGDNINSENIIEALEKTSLKNKGTIKNYNIRNGKHFVKISDKTITEEQYITFKIIEQVIYKSLVEDVSKLNKGKTFIMNKNIDIKVPRSEKTFVDNFPFGTEILTDNNDFIFGINWTYDKAGNDLDLSYLDLAGNKIGWNSNYYTDDQNVIYSGDIAMANPDATELIYIKDKSAETNPGLINVNIFSGKDEGAKYKFFIAKENLEKDKNNIKNRMIDNANIVFSTEITANTKSEILGINLKDRFVFQQISSGNKIVSINTEITSLYLKYIENNQKNLISLKQLLLDAGLTEIEENKKTEDIKIDFDFVDIKKDTIIGILTK